MALHDERDRLRGRAHARSRLAGVALLSLAAACAPANQNTNARASAQPAVAPTATSGSAAPSPTPVAGWAAARGIAGHWTGTWHAVEAPAATAGQAELVVLDRGLIRGTLRTTLRGVEGELVGQLRPQGNFIGACRVPSLGATLRLEGSVQFDPAGTAVASLRVKIGDDQVGTVDASLSRH